MEKEQIVASSMINSQTNLSVVGAFQLVQDAITELTGTLKIDGITTKAKYNAFWVFVKTKIKMLKNLVWNEKISVSAFISGITLAKMYIDVEVKNSSGEIALCSKTEMCAIDLETQRIRKVESVGVTESMVSEHRASNIEFGRIDDGDVQVVDEVQIKYTNIDFCHHTNNLEYIRLLMNTYTVAEIEQRQIREIEVVYINQSYEKEVLEICKKRDGEKDTFLIKREETPVVRCEIIFEK